MSSSPSPAAESSSSASTAKKKVYLIRHAESLENQRIASMFSCFGDLKRFSMPKKSEVGECFELLNISANADAPISPLGWQQCEAMKAILYDKDFLKAQNIELVAHSPLFRAKETCQTLLGCSSGHVIRGNDDNGTTSPPSKTKSPSADVKQPTTLEEKNPSPEGAASAEAPKAEEEEEEMEEIVEREFPDPVQRVVNLELLSEKTHMEWIPGNTGSFEQRVANFQNWLSHQPETVVCVVGHSQFFKTLLGLPFKVANCDVYQAEFDALKTRANEPIIMYHGSTADEVTLKPQWYDLKLLYSLNQQQPQPADLFSPAAHDNDDI